MQISVNGSKKHYISNVKVERENGTAIASGRVSGQLVSVTYTGEVVSKFGTSEAKPWLRQVREDLVRQYISIYGDVVARAGSRALPSEKIAEIKTLYAEGLSVIQISDKTGVCIPTIYKYIDGEGKYFLLVDKDFMAEISIAFKVDGFKVIIGSEEIDLEGMRQIDAVRRLKRLKEEIESERETIKKLVKELVSCA